MVKYTQAVEVRIGDVIEGPDGISTVIDVQPVKNGYEPIHFDFAEGGGNRCGSFGPSQQVRIYKRAKHSFALGYVVGKDGQVKVENVFEVSEISSDSVVVSIVKKGPPGAVSRKIARKQIGHIIGNFKLVLD